jgi:serine/threonine-protein kinase
MAAVYLGEHTTLQLPMAIKILHDHLSDTSDILARFKAEAQSVAALRHPNIVQVFDFDMIDDRPYIAMEYVRGITFSTYLNDLHQRELRLPIGMIASLINGISSALDYAHERGIVHRDIKPANIILRQGKSPIRSGQPLPTDAEPILTDFGIARIVDATAQTATGTILGTPAYMSPEQVDGTKVDHRTDIYSLGIILYEMLAGVPPFVSNSDTPVSILMKHLDEEPPDLDQVSPSVQSIVDKALEKDRQKRFQWAGAMAKALSNAVKPELTSILRSSKVAEQKAGGPAREVDPKTQKREKVGGWKWPLSRVVGLGALGVVGLVVVVTFAIFGGSADSPVEREPSQVPTSVVAAQPTTSPPNTLTEPTVEVAPTSVPVVVNDQISGEAAFQDASINATINGLEPPSADMAYRAWLIGERKGVVEGEEEVEEIVWKSIPLTRSFSKLEA